MRNSQYLYINFEVKSSHSLFQSNFLLVELTHISFSFLPSYVAICDNEMFPSFDQIIFRLWSKLLIALQLLCYRFISGETVYVIGYPLFSSKIHSVKGPSLTHGYVAKVHPATMLLTTCVANSGASGGALIRPNGELLGLVANNVIVQNENLLIPHITIVIPSSVFWPPVERFCSSQRE